MPIYDGVVALDDTTLIPVIVGVEKEVVRLSTDGTEIGAWSPDECAITYEGEGVFTINAEDESLRFLPRDPDSFAAAVDARPGRTAPPGDDVSPTADDGPAEAAPPKRITKVLFYLLATMTAGLGIWALVSLLF